jgi:hypothetical protein
MEHLLSKWGTLSSNPSTAKRERTQYHRERKRRKRGRKEGGKEGGRERKEEKRRGT